MKRYWILLSALANVALLIAWLGWPSGARSAKAQGGTTAASVDKAGGAATSLRGTVTEADAQAVKLSLTEAQRIKAMSEDWNLTDLAALRDRLRARGIPEEQVRSAIRVLAAKSFGLGAEYIRYQTEVPYWQQVSSASVYRKEREAQKPYQAALRLLFGEGFDTNLGSSGSSSIDLAFDGLNPEKRAQVQAILRDYNEMRNDVFIETVFDNTVITTPEEARKLKYIESQKLEDLRRVLTSEELENYVLRTDQTIDQMRRNLAGFRPTEEEFRAIYRYTEQQMQGASSDATGVFSDYVLREKTLREAHSALVDILGAERAMEYKLATDPMTAPVTRLLSRLDLPIVKAAEVASVQRDTLTQAGRIRADASLTPGQKQAQIKSLAEGAATSLTNVLGSRGYEAYQQSSSTSYWLKSLTGSPPPR